MTVEEIQEKLVTPIRSRVDEVDWLGEIALQLATQNETCREYLKIIQRMYLESKK